MLMPGTVTSPPIGTEIKGIDFLNWNSENSAMHPKQLIEYFGTQAKAARALGLSQPTVAGWVEAGEIPEARQYQVEIATSGALRADKPALRVQAA